MTTIDITPNPENLARLFRDQIAQSHAKIERLGYIATLVDVDCRDQVADIFGNDCVDDIVNALDLATEEEKRRIKIVEESLAECDLVIRANGVVAGLKELSPYVTAAEGDFIDASVELISDLNEVRIGRKT